MSFGLSPKGEVVGIVLGSGGALTATQRGVVKALEDKGYKPGLIAGTPMGAVNTAITADKGIDYAKKHLEECIK